MSELYVDCDHVLSKQVMLIPVALIFIDSALQYARSMCSSEFHYNAVQQAGEKERERNGVRKRWKEERLEGKERERIRRGKEGE